MHHFFAAHAAIIGIVAFWLFSAIVGGMPPPTSTSTFSYRWAHASLHLLAGNLTAAVSARYPAMVAPPGTQIEHAESTTVTTPSR